MKDPNALVKRYISVWHEPDEEQRRKSIAELWAPEGIYVDPSCDVGGYEALHGVVTAAHEEFVRPGKYMFRARDNAQSHHNIVRFNWERADLESGSAIEDGFDLFVLDGEGRILADYKFIGPPVLGGELNTFTERYVRLWQEPDAQWRRKLIEELWAPDGSQIYPSGEPQGHDALFARVTRSYDLFIQPGEYRFRSVGDANGHHNLVRFNWEMVRVGTGDVADVGFELFVRDQGGRILFDYQFVGP